LLTIFPVTGAFVTGEYYNNSLALHFIMMHILLSKGNFFHKKMT